VETEPDNNTSPTHTMLRVAFVHTLQSPHAGSSFDQIHMAHDAVIFFSIPRTRHFERGPMLGGVTVFSRRKFRSPPQVNAPKAQYPDAISLDG